MPDFVTEEPSSLARPWAVFAVRKYDVAARGECARSDRHRRSGSLRAGVNSDAVQV
jgi:hypothetical protein